MSRLVMGIALIAVLVILGCSRNGNPVVDSPDQVSNLGNTEQHVITGMYNAVFDPEAMDFTVTPARDAAAATHFDFTNFHYMCPGGCLKFKVASYDSEGWISVLADIKNPTSLIVYDARLVFADLKGKEIADYDGITPLFPGQGLPYKPFVAWAKERPFRQVPGSFQGSATFKIRFLPGSELNTVYITECSFSNIEEPYDIVSHGIIEGELTPAGDTTAKLGVEILDWQDDVESANAYLIPFNNQIMPMVYDPLPRIWTVEFTNQKRLPEGEYDVLIEGISPNPQSVSLYKFVKIPVIVPPPTGTPFVYTKSLGLGISEIHTIYTSGMGDTALTNFTRSTVANGVSTNMAKIIFTSDYLTPFSPKAFLMNFDGTDISLLYKPQAVSCNEDGSIVLLYDPVNLVMWVWNLVLYDLYQLPPTGVEDCVMSANGQKIAYIAREGLFKEIFSCDITGGNIVKLTSDGEQTALKENITISDDGMKIGYNAFDPSLEQDDMEIFSITSIMPDTQQNITNNENIDDTKPQMDNQGRKIVYVSTDDRGFSNIYLWDQLAGISPVTADAGAIAGYDNPDISSDGMLMLFEKAAFIGTQTNIWAYDLTVLPPVLSQVTTDGQSTKPLITAN
jgi:hypothetical protein